MPELAILYPDDKPDPDLTFKRFGLPARLCGVALG